jgi:glucose/arabinose dehydrogenase
VSHFSRALGLALTFILLAIACAPAAPPAPGQAVAKQGTPTPRESSRPPTSTPREAPTPEPREHNTPTPVAKIADDIKITTVVDGVLLPMSMRFAPDGRLFFNEVSKGTVRIMGADGVLQDEPFVTLKVAKRKEMGALGLALHPDFATNHWVYVFYSQSKGDSDDPDDNRIVRFTERDGLATERTVIFKGASNRNLLPQWRAHRVRARRQAVCDDRRRQPG